MLTTTLDAFTNIQRSFFEIQWFSDKMESLFNQSLINLDVLGLIVATACTDIQSHTTENATTKTKAYLLRNIFCFLDSQLHNLSNEMN